MTTILLCIALALLVVLIGLVIWMISRFRPGPSMTDIEDRLGRSEGRLTQAINEQRTALDTSLRETAQSNAEAQRRLISELISNIERIREETKTAIADRFASTQQGIATALSDARRNQDERLDRVELASKEFSSAFSAAISDLKAGLIEADRIRSENHAKAGNELRDRLTLSLTELQTALTKTISEMRETQANAFTALQDRVQNRLEEVRKDNTEQLEKIRATVEEKLQSTLEARLGESFKIVSDRLEQVYKGLGEMQQLATGVGDLKRMLTNVRTRGTFGEVQLAALLEQVMTPQQYAVNVATVPGSTERVEFAIRLPGRDEAGSVVWLPIDAKFPQEDYQRLQLAYETADLPSVESARSSLRQRLMAEAQKIQQKYLAPPHTTDFALLFLPTEGLYAEILRIPGLCEDLQARWRIIAVGPTNLFGLLNSLQMGFRTLAIEQRSSEVWKVLGAVKTEFSKFGEVLESVSKKLTEAGNKINDVSVRSRVMERKLRDVEALPELESRLLLETTAPETDEPI